jgi:hypothetical protein
MDLMHNIEKCFDKEEDEFILGKFKIVRREYSDKHYVYFDEKYIGEFSLEGLVTNEEWISDFFIFNDYFKKRKVSKNHHILYIWDYPNIKEPKTSAEVRINEMEKKLIGFVLLWEDEKNGHIIPLSVSIKIESLAPTREVLVEFSNVNNVMWLKYGPRRYKQFNKNNYNGRIQNINNSSLNV